MILIDTSAWVDFFRGKAGQSARVHFCLEDNSAALCGPVITELRRGFQSAREKATVLLLFDGCHFLEQPDDLWVAAGDLGAQLRGKGHTVKTLDLLIAVHALTHQVPILTSDSDFSVIARLQIGLHVLPMG